VSATGVDMFSAAMAEYLAKVVIGVTWGKALHYIERSGSVWEGSSWLMILPDPW